MRVIFLGGTCKFCDYIIANYPQISESVTDLVRGRCYVVREMRRYRVHGLVGYGVTVVDSPLPPQWESCSCQFREIGGDADEWREILRKHKHKEPQNA